MKISTIPHQQQNHQRTALNAHISPTRRRRSEEKPRHYKPINLQIYHPITITAIHPQISLHNTKSDLKNINKSSIISAKLHKKKIPNIQPEHYRKIYRSPIDGQISASLRSVTFVSLQFAVLSPENLSGGADQVAGSPDPASRIEEP